MQQKKNRSKIKQVFQSKNMNFILGYIAGIVTAGLVFTILAFFRAGIEKRVKIIETVLARAGPKPKGYIFEQEEDVEEARRELLEKNKREGRDTPLEDLRNI